MSTRRLVSGLVELLRPPNVFTAVADSLAGLILVRGGAPALSDPGLWCLGASASLYLGGMALNDYFDRTVDARERPQRPIPSGAVPASLAAGLGAFLLILGIGFAACAGGGALVVSLLLAAAILAYDGVLKGTPIGFINMGACRGLNFLLPMTMMAPDRPAIFAAPILLGAYITVLTFLSRDEVVGGGAPRLRRGLAAMAAVLALMAAAVAALGAALAGWIFYLAVVTRAAQLFGPLHRDASGSVLGRAVGGGILLIPLLDATFVAAAGHLAPALAVAALMLPALWLKRFYSPT